MMDRMSDAAASSGVALTTDFSVEEAVPYFL